MSNAAGMSLPFTTPAEFFRDKRVLVMGIGSYGGGFATAKWVAQFAPYVCVTDKRNADAFPHAVRELEQYAHVDVVCGVHRTEDFAQADIVVVSPGIPDDNPYLTIARESGAVIENDASLFFRFVRSPVIAVTGTRGKSTTTAYIQQLLARTDGVPPVVGNTPEAPLLAHEPEQSDPATPFVAELSSWQLRHLPRADRGPHVAILTNIFPDHLNWYGAMEAYVSDKRNIFHGQTKTDIAVLPFDDPWRTFIEGNGLSGTVWYTRMEELPKDVTGVYYAEDRIWFQENGVVTPLVHIPEYRKMHGMHGVQNLIAAIAGVRAYDEGYPFETLNEAELTALRAPSLRQEELFATEQYTVINDSAATAPEATMAAIERFADTPMVLITGGTDKELSYETLAGSIAEHISPERLILLEGSATEKLTAALCGRGYAPDDTLRSFSTLEECMRAARDAAQAFEEKGVIVFSPGAASFEKFQNEFDRGRTFAEYAQEYLP